MNELTLEERGTGLWFKDETKFPDTKYAIVLMYSAGRNDPRFVREGPLNPETVMEKVEKMLNDAEQGRYVNLNSQFINPDSIIGFKVDVWKTDTKRGDYGYYDY